MAAIDVGLAHLAPTAEDLAWLLFHHSAAEVEEFAWSVGERTPYPGGRSTPLDHRSMPEEFSPTWRENATDVSIGHVQGRLQPRRGPPAPLGRREVPEALRRPPGASWALDRPEVPHGH